MTDRMALPRFQALLAAYGATPARWPADERAAAEAFARADPRAARLLSEADAIDTLLFAHRVAAPSRALRTMVIESASARRPRVQRVRLWWTGLAFALAAGSGAVAGSAATAALEPVSNQLQIYDHDDIAVDDDASGEIAS